MAQAGGEQAQQAQEMLKDQDKLVEEIFSHEDKDKDGYISHEEWSGFLHDEAVFGVRKDESAFDTCLLM